MEESIAMYNGLLVLAVLLDLLPSSVVTGGLARSVSPLTLTPLCLTCVCVCVCVVLFYITVYELILCIYLLCEKRFEMCICL